MKGNYRISSVALNDIENIFQYTLERWSLQQADAYYRLIMQEIERMTQYFESGTELNHNRMGYRLFRVKSHFIIGRKGEDGFIEIIRILHRRMEISHQLEE